jgi:hypothetical protein
MAMKLGEVTVLSVTRQLSRDDDEIYLLRMRAVVMRLVDYAENVRP